MFTDGDNTKLWVEARISDLGGGYGVATSEIKTVVSEITHCLDELDEWAKDRPAGLGNPASEIDGKA